MFFHYKVIVFFSLNFEADPNGCEGFGKPPMKELLLFSGGHFFGIPEGVPGRADFKRDTFLETAQNVVSNLVQTK